jgi:dsDNA-specific endonuclease/ATPase MutS2
MSPQNVEGRVEELEERVTILEQLPARVDALTLQVVHLREEMHAGFSAVQTSLREEIRAGDEGLRTEISALREEIRTEIRNGDSAVMSQARVLHEDLIDRLKRIQEGLGLQG